MALEGVPVRVRCAPEPALPAEAMLSKSWCWLDCGVGVEYLLGALLLPRRSELPTSRLLEVLPGRAALSRVSAE